MEEKNFDLLYEILSVPSINDTAGEQIMAEFLAHKLLDNNIDCRIMPVSEHRSNVIAHIPGKDSERTVIWNGHMDTVAYGDLSDWNSDPKVPELKDNKLYVRGSSDMKGGVAGMIDVLLRWQKQGLQPDCNIILILTCDEEKGGTGAMAMLGQNILNQAEAFFIAEPTALNPCVAQKGCIWLELNIKGKASHGSYPELGVNALEEGFELCKSLKAFISQRESDLLGKSTGQVTMADGGSAANITAESARFVMDIRTVPGLSFDDIKLFVDNWQKQASDRSDNVLKCELNVLNLREAVSVSPDNEWLRKLAAQSEQIYPDLDVNDIGLNFFTDASAFVQENDWAPMILFGPGEPDLCHQPNEYLDLQKYEKFVNILDALFTQSTANS